MIRSIQWWPPRNWGCGGRGRWPWLEFVRLATVVVASVALLFCLKELLANELFQLPTRGD